jgi:hypothetical protein
MFKKLVVIISCVVVVVLSGCASNKDMYSWGQYEPQLHNYLNGESPEKLIVLMEKDLAAARQKDAKLPPGFYAHLGLLYKDVGRDQDFLAMINLEKNTYPDSTQYLNSLTKNQKK